MEATFRIGELAKRTGITVRTLHHYDEIGLLRPSDRTLSGHRLYGAKDVLRLQRIVSLRALGLPLAEIGPILERRDFSLARVLERHAQRIGERIDESRRLKRLIESVLEKLRSRRAVPVDDILKTIEVTTMFEKYYTPEQLEALKKRGEKIGPARIAEVQGEWAALIGEVRAEMKKGTDPASPRMQALAARWQSLIEEFTGGDPGIRKSLATMYRNEPAISEKIPGAPDGDVMAFVGKAVEASRGKKKGG